LKEHNDHYFDKRLKSKVEEGEFPFREEDWAKLEPRLDRLRNLFLFKWALGIGSGMILIGLGFFWAINGGKPINHSIKDKISISHPRNDHLTMGERGLNFKPERNEIQNSDHKKEKLESGSDFNTGKSNASKLEIESKNKLSNQNREGSMGNDSSSQNPHDLDSISIKEFSKDSSTRSLGSFTYNKSTPYSKFLKRKMFNPKSKIGDPEYSSPLENALISNGHKEIRNNSSTPSSIYPLIRLGKNANEDSNNQANEKSIIKPLVSNLDNGEFGIKILKREKNLDSLFLIPENLKTPTDISTYQIAKNEKYNRIKPKIKKEIGLNKPDYRWSISGILSPDFNEVNSINSSQLALNLGLIMAYHINNRWEIESGIIYGPKIYTAGSSAYQSSSFKQYSNLSSINANCNVLDIPLEIGYSFYQKGRSQFFMDFGLSTYFMQRETYSFNFINNGSTDDSTSQDDSTINKIKSYTYSLYNQNRHILGVADLMLEYHYRLSSRTNFGIAPYLKLPLTGIGQGKLDLISFGTQVQIHFNLGKTH